MSSMPCVTLAVSDDQIRRHCSADVADMICKYHYLLYEATHSEFITPAGFRKMKEIRVIPDWDMGFALPESEFRRIEVNIRERLENRKLFLLSEASFCVPGNYSIALFEDKEINVQSFTDPSRVVQIREKFLLRAMQKWFDYRDKIAEIEEKLELRETL